MDTYLQQAKNFEKDPTAPVPTADDDVKQEDMETDALYKAQGRPYALSSETSHGRQRYAARGGDEGDVRLYATPRMDVYRQQAKNFEKDPTAPVPIADEDVKQEVAAISGELA